MTWQNIQDILNFAANIIEIAVGCLALYLAYTQRDKISQIFSILLNYSLRLSLSDMKSWIKQLSENSVEDVTQVKKVRESLAHIRGKIQGNQILRDHLGNPILKRIVLMIDDIDNKVLVNESAKLTLQSEISELISTLEIKNHTSNNKNK